MGEEREADLSFLPHEVRATARPAGNGEVMWPLAAAGAALEGLATAGRVILGLDLRRYGDGGAFTEVAWTSFTPTGLGDSDASLAAARTALARSDRDVRDFGWVVVTWQ